MTTIADLGVKIHVEGMNAFDAGLKKAANSVDKLGDDVDKAGKKMDKATSNTAGGLSNLNRGLSSLSGATAGAFTVGAVVAFGTAVFNTTANFQKMEAVLTNTLGSNSEAQNAMLMIQDIAAKTPFSVEQLSASFVKLANRGIKPTSAEIIKLGDLAASTGKEFDMLTEALLDAMTGEFERLKEFGITASAQGDKVAFTFKGVTTTVQKTDQAIKNYVLSLGDVTGVSGSMAVISDTLSGKVSNLGDSFTSLFKAIGESNTGVMSKLVSLAKAAVDGITEVVKSNDQLAKEAASKTVSPYTEKVKKEFAELAEAAEKSGASVKGWLDNSLESQSAPFIQEMDKIGRKMTELQGLLANPAVATNPALSGDLNEDLLELTIKFKEAKGQLEALREAHKTACASIVARTEEQVGILTKLRGELDLLQKDQLNAYSAGEIESINASIAAKEEEIKKYLELGDAQRKQQAALRDIQKELQLNIKYGKALGDSYDVIGGKSSILEGGIKKLIDLGLSPASVAVSQYVRELNKVHGILQEIASRTFEFPAPKGQKPPSKLPTNTAKVDLTQQKTEYDQFTQSLMAGSQAATAALQGLAMDGFSFLGQTIGDVFSGNFQGVEAFFGGMLNIVSSFLQSLGEACIAVGTAGLAMKLAFSNPFAAIAAGVALIALSGVAASIAARGPVGGGGGTGSRPTYNSPTTTRAFTPPGSADNTETTVKIQGTDLVAVLRKTGYKTSRGG